MQFNKEFTRDGLKEMKSRMAQRGPVPFSPRELLRQYSDMIDHLVRDGFRKAHAHSSLSSICLVAVGGYGRAELAPYSDIDLLLLHSNRDQDNLSPFIENILYPLWDLGLEISCSARFIPECLRMAQSDLYVKTGLIDARYLDGDYEIFRTLYEDFSKKVLYQNIHKFAGELRKDLYVRHQKYEDPAYVLEPNLKEGKGGLRDFQIGRWAIRAKYKTDRWDSILSPDHSRMLERNIEFQWTLRNQAHLLNERRQDDLTFELQEKIAPLLGFPSGAEGIELMMREYHLSSQSIQNFSTNLLDRVAAEPSLFKKVFFFLRRRKINNQFGVRDGEITLLDPLAFKKDPSRLMVLFDYCQNYRMEMDDRTEETVIEMLPFINESFYRSETVNRSFLSLLQRGEGVDLILKKMHALGFLSRYIPEFSSIEGKVHYDLYHVHPTDIHSLFAVEELVKLRTGRYEKEYPLLTSVIRETVSLDILLLAGLLHDIGKGKEGDHSIIGAEIVKTIGSRLGLSAEENILLYFLVRNHLFMIETASRRDLLDEQAIERFVNVIKDQNQLNMLYLLTFADIKAVGPEAWTPWKHSLLMELFLKASRFFDKEKGPPPLVSLPPELTAEYSEDLPSRYLSSFSQTEIVEHIVMARSLGEKTVQMKWFIEENRQAKVTLCTKDRYGLFSKITGSLFLNRLNILQAQIHTWGNGVALDTFEVEDATGEIEQRLDQFKKDLTEILEGKATLKNLLTQRNESKWTHRKVLPKVVTEVKINNQDSDFFTIIEITGEDRLGILFEMTQALTDHGCNIYFARISTLGNRIVDVFYVQDTWGEKIEEAHKIDLLQKTILQKLTS
ncbi:MAG: [protein-PII] uridylyltransferase [Deltaproteobacteria bacterium]|nr:[protein-PII] uridylyltransferase [Deltaproteobacteria bacterium]